MTEPLVAPTDGAEPAADGAAVLAERVRLLYDNAVLANLAVVAVTLVVSAWFHDLLGWNQLLAWWGVMATGVVYRLFLIRGYRRRSVTAPRSIRWLRRYLFGTAIVAAGWALITGLGMASPSAWDRALASILAAGIMGSSVSVLGSIPMAAYLYSLPAVAVAMVMLVAHGGDEVWVAVGLVFYSYLVLRSARNMCATLVRSLELRFGNQRLAERLGAEVERRRLAQTALESHQQNLERVVAQRTAELTRAKEAAETANRAKSRFLAAMSHEIRTPLHGVQGTVELLGGTEMSPRQSTYVEALGVAVRSLREVVNQVLDFSRIEASGITLARLPFDPRVLVEEACAQYAERAFAKGLELVGRVPEALPAGLLGDPARLGQVLGNLVSNAVKLTGQGEVVVSAEVQAQAADRVMLRCEVMDTGPGVPGDMRERIFSSFVQVDESDTRVHEGTGLGLAIARGLVTAAGGEIGVREAAGGGSVFWFTANLERDPAGEPEPAFAPSAAGLRLLVADDNAAAAGALAELLRAWGGEVEIATDAAVLSRRLGQAADAEAPYDLLLLDCFLSGDDYLAESSTVGSLPAGGACRRVLLVPFGKEPGGGSGPDYLTKPVRREALRRCLDDRPTGLDQAPQSEPLRQEDALSGLRVLVAEDNPVNQIVVEEMLLDLGCRPRLVANGAEALESLEREDFDLVLMDCRMPVLDGYQAAARQRERERAQGVRSVPIVALTANTAGEERERALAAGMDGFLGKPMTGGALAALLREMRDATDRPSAGRAPDRPQR